MTAHPSMVGSGLSALASPVLPDLDSAAAPVESRNKFHGDIPVDLNRFRAVFPDRWQAFIKAHFRDIRHVQFSLGVSEKTARDYWAGTTSPRAEVALYAVATHPGALAELMGVA